MARKLLAILGGWLGVRPVARVPRRTEPVSGYEYAMDTHLSGMLSVDAQTFQDGIDGLKALIATSVMPAAAETEVLRRIDAEIAGADAAGDKAVSKSAREFRKQLAR